MNVIKERAGYEYIYFPSIFRVYCERLQMLVEEDAKKDLRFSKLATALCSATPSGHTDNCLTWAVDKLNKAILPENGQMSVPRFFPIPTAYIRGQYMQNTDEKKIKKSR